MDQVNFIYKYRHLAKTRDILHFVSNLLYTYVLTDGRDRKHGNFFSAIADVAYRFISFNCKYSFNFMISHS